MIRRDPHPARTPREADSDSVDLADPEPQSPATTSRDESGSNSGEPVEELDSQVFHQRMKEIFCEALELPDRERVGYVDRRTQGQPTLRSQVLSLLAQANNESDDDHFLAFGQQVRQTLEQSPISVEANVPDRIASYEILDVLGVGGMGTVYEARQQNPSRRVALKVVSSGNVSAKALRRFELEAELLGRLQHRSIAQIFEAGIYYPEGRSKSARAYPFFAMELVKGTTLREFAAKQHLKKLLRVFLRVCEGVHFAHTKGVIHRDLKPANIIVTPRGEPKIVDFGVARVSDEDYRSTTLKTAVGQLVGTIEYMSPEQAEGDPSQLDTRSDVYALGVILFELVSGELPYAVRGKLLHEAVRTIREEEARPLGAVDARFRRSDLEIILAKALAKDRERRYQSALELAADVHRYLNDQPIEARAPDALYQLSRFAKRNRALLIGIITTAVGLLVGLSGLAMGTVAAGEGVSELLFGAGLGIVGLAVGVVAARRAITDLYRQRTLATRATAAAKVESAKATAMQEFLSTLFQAALPDRARGRVVTVREVLDQAVEHLDELADEGSVQSWAHHMIGSSYAALGEIEKAEYHLRSALRSRRQDHGYSSPEALASLDALVAVLIDSGKTPEAEELARLSYQGHALLGEAGELLARAANNLGRALRVRGKTEEAENVLREALNRFQADESVQNTSRVDSVVGEEWLELRHTLALVLRDQRRLPEAESHLEAVVSQRRERWGESNPATLRSSATLASIWQRQGRNAEALDLITSGLERQQKICGEEHSDVLLTLEYLAELHHGAGRPAEALPHLERIYHTRIRTLGRGNLKTVQSINAMATTLVLLGRAPEALRLYRDITSRLERSDSAPGPLQVALLANMGIVHGLVGDRAAALTCSRLAVQRAERIFEKNDPRLLKLLVTHAKNLSENGNSAESERLLARCHHLLADDPHSSLRLPNMAQSAPGNAGSELHPCWNLGNPRGLFLNFGDN